MARFFPQGTNALYPVFYRWLNMDIDYPTSTRNLVARLIRRYAIR